MKLGIFFVVIMSGILFGLSKYDGKTARTKVWKVSKYERMPASLFSNIDLTVFKDYFSSSSIEEGVKYDMTANFWTNKDTEYLKTKALKSLKEGFLKTATTLTNPVPDEEIILTKLLKESLIESFVGNFVKTLKIYKIIDSVFQIDLNFRPRNDHWTNYNSELMSNQLIQMNRTGLLKEQMNDSTMSAVDKIIRTKFPSLNSKERYTYSGGVITIWINLLDNLLKPTKIDSYIRYRRYYQMDHSFKLTSLAIGGNRGMINSIFPAQRNKDQNEYLTVDIYKKINGKTFSPYLDKMDIYFGKLIPSINRRGNTINRTIATKPKTVKSSNYFLKVKTIKNRRPHVFDIPLGALSYSFIDKTLTHHSKAPGHDYDSSDADYELANSLINKYGTEFIQKLGFKRFHNSLR